MQVRIQVRRADPAAATLSGARALARSMVGVLMAQLLVPASLAAYVLALWRLGSDLQMTETFAISQGFFSHWQVWLGLAAGAHAGSAFLARHRDEAPKESRVRRMAA
ncbi:MAG: hypothetical protein FJW40_06100 [Acidobacteria bacterium]|nr:hypothetical protein [Acidobacteriota bacterium]